MKIKLMLCLTAYIATMAFANESFSQIDTLDDPIKPFKRSTVFLAGPVAGYNNSFHNAKIASFVDDPICPFFNNGFSGGYYLGISFEYLIGNIKDSRTSVIARVLYNSMPSYFSKEGDSYPSLVEDQNSQNGYSTVMSSTNHTIDVSYTCLTAEVCFKINLFNDFGITCGPTFDLPLSSRMEQVYSLTNPDYVQFKRNNNSEYRYGDNDRKIYVYEGEVPEMNAYRLGLKLGLQYEINYLIKGAYLVPAIYYNQALTKLSSKENWFVNALQIGMDLRFAIK